MCIEELDRHDESVFNPLWCPVCGCTLFTEIPYEGVFCKNCNTEVTIKESSCGDTVYGTFMTESTWNLHKAKELNRRPLPVEKVQAVIKGGPGGYEVVNWSPERPEWDPMEQKSYETLQEERQKRDGDAEHLA